MKLFLLAVLLLALFQAHAAADDVPSESKTWMTIYPSSTGTDSDNADSLPTWMSVNFVSAETDLTNTVPTETASQTDLNDALPTDTPFKTRIGPTKTTDSATGSITAAPYGMAIIDTAIASSDLTQMTAAAAITFPALYSEEQQYASKGWITKTSSYRPGVSAPAGFMSTGIAVATWSQCFNNKDCAVGYVVYTAAYPKWYSHATCDTAKAIATTTVPKNGAQATGEPFKIGPFDIASAKNCYYSVDQKLTCEDEPSDARCMSCAGVGCEEDCDGTSWVIGGTCGW